MALTANNVTSGSSTASVTGTADTANITDAAVTLAKLSQSLQSLLTFNVKDYGALGDDSHNDQPNIQNAINALLAAGGGVLRIPKGIYRIDRDSSTGNIQFQGLRVATTNNPNFVGIWVRGDGPGVTVLRQPKPAEVASGWEVNLIFFDGLYSIANPPVAGQGIPYSNILVSGITFQGQPTNATEADPNSQKGALLEVFGKNNTESGLMRNLNVTNCQFLDPGRDAVQLFYVKRCRFENNSFEYYKNVTAPTGWSGAHRVGIFSGNSAIVETVVVGNNFDGNINGSVTTEGGADGFIWFGPGGDITIAGNTIRNYKLEAIQMTAAPATIGNNAFLTLVGAGGAKALVAYVDAGSTFYLSPQNAFTGNVVKGGGVGVQFFSTNQQTTAPRTYGTVTGNLFLLNPNLGGSPTYAVGAHMMQQLIIANNQVEAAGQLFNYTPLSTDTAYQINMLIIDGNHALGCTDVCILLNWTLLNKGGATIQNNVLSARPGYLHLFAVKPIGSTEFISLLVNDNVYLTYDSTLSPPHSPTPARISIQGTGSGTVYLNGLRQYWSSIWPPSPATGYSPGDIIYNTTRSKAGVMFYSCQATDKFEPVFSAARGVSITVKLQATTTGTPLDFLSQEI